MLLHAPDPRPVSQALANRLWSRLRLGQVGGHHFSRNCPVGRHIADFYCPEAGLIVQLVSARAADRGGDARAAQFELDGYRVVRLSEYEMIDDMDASVRKIRDALGTVPSSGVAQPLRYLH